MKRILVLSIYMFAMVTGIATYANASSKDGERKKSEITLTLNDVKEGQLLSIKDINGIVLYNSTIATSGLYNNKFDLTALPNGTYYFEHEKGYEIKIIPFTVSIGEVTFNKKNEKSIFKPVVNLKNNNLYLTQLSLDKSDVEVKIYYTSDNSEFNLIHSEDISNTTNINRIYKLAEKRTGNYKVIINANGRDYVEYFTI
ncbi:hypothetical protein [Formosa sp. PL04]|uniref:hypothetical protein n=1 Tax=Formosa sp. PL04 TaxID=3081755 RepID=UPI002982B057|nr:hypothetical protein [Formosa sp. PL04]MDW5289484.1 hypothetical protein [Formosa sp. PL04]